MLQHTHYHTMPYHTMLQHTHNQTMLQHTHNYTMPYHTMLQHTHYYTMPYHTIPHHTIPHHIIPCAGFDLGSLTYRAYLWPATPVSCQLITTNQLAAFINHC
jgi:hypothetical protein